MAAFDWNSTKTVEESGFRKKAGNRPKPSVKFIERLNEQMGFMDMDASSRPTRGLWFKESGDQTLFTARHGSRKLTIAGKQDHVIPTAQLRAAMESLRAQAEAGDLDAELERVASGMGPSKGTQIAKTGRGKGKSK